MVGEVVENEPILLDASFFMNFILEYHEEFKDMSVQSTVEYIFGRGKAEITRQIKTAAKTRENKVYGDLARKYNLTLEQAQDVLSKAAARVSAEK
jgi:hypothetical protein